MSRTALSLFTSGGIGDLAIRQAGYDILVSNEKLKDRHALFAFNFPGTCAITGSIWQHIDRIETETRKRLGRRELTLLYATPPCQGMSKNGRGKLLSAVRAGRKPSLWDFLDGRPRVAAMFYASNLERSDWGKIVQPRSRGGRTTSVSIMNRSGIRKMYEGRLCVLSGGGYREFLNTRNRDDLICH